MSRPFAFSRVRLQVEALEDRYVLSTTSYVNALYTDLLHRPGSPGEVAGWAAQIDNGLPPVQATAAFTSSAEFLSNLVRADYQLFLQRQPLPTETQGWVSQLQNGLGEQQLQATFLGSAEFYAIHANDNGTWLKAVYQSVLGRGPGSDESTFWIGQLQTGLSRQQAALQIVTSPEANARLVTAAYEQLLGHAPDAGGLVFWSNQLAQGLAPSHLVSLIASTPEFINIQGGLGSGAQGGAPDTTPSPDTSNNNLFQLGAPFDTTNYIPEPVLVPDTSFVDNTFVANTDSGSTSSDYSGDSADYGGDSCDCGCDC